MKRLSKEILTRYRDNELSRKEAREVEYIVARSPEYKKELDDLDNLGKLVRVMNEVQLSSVSFDGFEKRVLNGLESSRRPGLLERSRIWWSEFFTYRKKIWIPAASLAGVAVSLFLAIPIFYGTPGHIPMEMSGAQNNGIWTAAAEETSQGGSEVSVLSQDPSVGTAYSVTNDRGEPIGVAWIYDR